MPTDYASELLRGGGTRRATSGNGGGKMQDPAMTDYASELMRPQQVPAKSAQTQSAQAKSAQANLPARQAIQLQSDSARAADPLTIATASLANDPQARARYYAEQRGLPLSRYQVVDDRVAYQDEDGQWYLERPNVQWTDPGSIVQNLAGGVGPALPAVAGAAAGLPAAPLMLLGPLGTGTAMGAAGAGAAAGQAGREMLAEQFVGQAPSLGRMAYEGAAGALGEGIGAGLGKLATRGLARDIGELDRPASQALEDAAARRNVRLTPAETTNLGSLKAEQKYLGNMPGTRNRMEQFYRERAEEVGRAVDDELGRISPVTGSEAAGALGREASQGAMERAAAERAAAARPLYQRAFQEASDVDVGPVIRDIEMRLKMLPRGAGRELRQVQRMLTREGGLPETDLQVLHNAKVQLDDLIARSGPRGLGPSTRRDLTQLKGRLLEALDEASPSYRAARQVYSDLSPGVQQIREGAAGVIADLPDARLQDAASRLFAAGRIGPAEVGRAKRAIQSTSPEAWQALKRAFLEENWLKAGRETQTGSALGRGAKFRQALFGDLRQRQILKEALEPDELRSLTELADVLEATGRVSFSGSDTAWNQEIQRTIRDNARNPLARLLAGIRIDRPGEAVADWMTERGLARHADQLVDAITTDQGQQTIRQLRQLDAPGAVKRALLGHIIVQGGRAAGLEPRAALPPYSGPVQPIQRAPQQPGTQLP